ncbi:hypothetical protein [Mesorhizobium sp. CN2-181]|uniref:hypothetical protein n=1 Tax=Mesorhizobium yinganensis TaxID=3157707 RepID=UPI0032B7EAF5
MSYDLMVFAPADAPRVRQAFLDWYEEQTEWSEDHRYDDTAVTTPGLSAWYGEMQLDFPDLNGPSASDLLEDDSPSVTDYSIGRSVIYAGFRWSEADRAYTSVRALAVKHGVGFFNVSAADGEIWFPPEGGPPKSEVFPELTLTLEGQPAFNSPSSPLIEAAVDWLDPAAGPGFLILSHSNGRYAQAGGGKDAITAEWREYFDGGFGHWVAGLRTSGSNATITIPGHGTHFSIRANERLSNESAKTILLAFARGEPRSSDFVWREKTDEFGERALESRKPWWRFWR